MAGRGERAHEQYALTTSGVLLARALAVVARQALGSRQPGSRPYASGLCWPPAKVAHARASSEEARAELRARDSLSVGRARGQLSAFPAASSNKSAPKASQMAAASFCLSDEQRAASSKQQAAPLARSLHLRELRPPIERAPVECRLCQRRLTGADYSSRSNSSTRADEPTESKRQRAEEQTSRKQKPRSQALTVSEALDAAQQGERAREGSSRQRRRRQSS